MFQVQDEKVGEPFCQPVEAAIDENHLIFVHVAKVVVRHRLDPRPGIRVGIEDMADERVVGSAAERPVVPSQHHPNPPSRRLGGQSDEHGVVVDMKPAHRSPEGAPIDHPELRRERVADVEEALGRDAGAAQQPVAGGADPDPISEEREGERGEGRGRVGADERGGAGHERLEEDHGVGGRRLVVRSDEAGGGNQAAPEFAGGLAGGEGFERQAGEDVGQNVDGEELVSGGAHRQLDAMNRDDG